MPVSFFIPAFNYAQYIGQAIGSIMDRNFEDGDELVVCDDGSTDNTVEELGRLQRKWPHIKIITHEENRGGGAARNTAIRRCSNPILFCLDADNVLAPNNVPRLKQFLLDNGADVAAFREMYYFGSVPEMVRWPMDMVTIEHYLRGASVPGLSGNYMFTKASWERVGGYPEDTWRDTWGLGLRLAFAGAKIAVMPDGYYYHRRGHDSYYMRGTRELSPSRASLRVLRPFLHLLNEEDVEYVTGSGRDTWVEHLAERPLRLRGKQ